MMLQEPQQSPLDLIKECAAHVQVANWESRLAVVNAVLSIEKDLAELVVLRAKHAP